MSVFCCYHYTAGMLSMACFDIQRVLHTHGTTFWMHKDSARCHV